MPVDDDHDLYDGDYEFVDDDDYEDSDEYEVDEAAEEEEEPVEEKPKKKAKRKTAKKETPAPSRKKKKAAPKKARQKKIFADDSDDDASEKRPTGSVESQADDEAQGAEGDAQADEYGRTAPTSNYVVHIYELKKFHRTIDRQFTPEEADAFANEYNRTARVYGRWAVPGKADLKPGAELAP